MRFIERPPGPLPRFDRAAVIAGERVLPRPNLTGIDIGASAPRPTKEGSGIVWHETRAFDGVKITIWIATTERHSRDVAGHEVAIAHGVAFLAFSVEASASRTHPTPDSATGSDSSEKNLLTMG
jgi:hypothetical protein